VWNTIGSISTTDVSGKIRLTRSGSSCSGYKWNGSSWDQIGNSYTWSESQVLDTVRFEHGGWDSMPDFTFDYDNFKINSGTVIWPEGTHPNRKKIALTKNNGTTQCPVEIEQWDFYNGKVNLWTKIPTVVFDIGTDIYLYYDNSKDDNDSYVGDVGSTPAQNVWDSNFVGVWHMSQDPTGESGAVKDSTSNINHGAASGTMTSEDLVDGKVGKALDFDGVDDRVVVANASELRGMAAITVEGILNVASKGNWEKILDYSSATSQNTDKKYRLQFDNQADQGLNFALWDSSDVAIGNVLITAFPITDCYFAGVYTGETAADSVKAYKDGAVSATASGTGNNVNNTSAGDLWLGSEQWTPPRNPYHGISDEFRISDIARTAAWLKATYHSNWDTLLTYGNEEKKETEIKLINEIIWTNIKSINNIPCASIKSINTINL
jgi:hypothetical protein